MKNLLMLFLKEPIPGKVKTRLAKHLGSQEACDIYRGFVHMISQKCFSPLWDTHVYYQCEAPPQELQSIFKGAILFPQNGEDLGGKMANAFEASFTKGYEKVTVIGGDSPDVPPDVYTESFDKLSYAEAVIGPSNDGGYYLLSLRKLVTPIFKNMSWGESSVLQDTIEKLKAEKISHQLLRNWYDIDTWEDYQIFLEKHPDFKPLPCA